MRTRAVLLFIGGAALVAYTRRMAQIPDHIPGKVEKDADAERRRKALLEAQDRRERPKGSSSPGTRTNAQSGPRVIR